MQKTKYAGRVLAALALAVIAASCTRARITEQYQKDGVEFKYYSDWKVTKDAPVAGKANVRAINIEGPEHAVVALICVPPASAQTLDQFAAAVADRRVEAIEARLSVGSIKTAEVSKGTSEPTTAAVAGQERRGILQHFSIDLLGVQVPHEARFYVVQGSRYKIMVMYQVATSHAETTHPGSELILSTLTIEGLS